VLVYLNGEYLPQEQARIPVDDRGFLFADGVYEVIRVYHGQPYDMAAHLERLRRGLGALRIEERGAKSLDRVAHRLLAENGVAGDGVVYVQVTRGVAPRKHAFPPHGTTPTVYVAARPFQPYPTRYWEEGVAAITVPDTRWARCDIKSISLLPNVLANQAAHEAGAFEALLVRDGVLLEGSHSNVWAVRDGRLFTFPRCNYILAGITRKRVFELATALGIEAAEEPIFTEALHDLEEVFLSGTTTEIMPVVRVDGRDILDGEPGPVTRRIRKAFREALPR
jgi:D-alanine transaminase